MADEHEGTSGTGGRRVDASTKAREEVRKEIEEAKKPGNELQKRTLATKIRDFFENQRTEVSQINTETLRQARGEPHALDDVKGQRQDAHVALIHLLEGIKSGVVEVPNEKSKAFITNLYDKLGDDGITLRNASMIYPIVNYALNNEPTGEQLKTEFNKVAPLLGYVSKEALDRVTDAIVKTASEGHIEGISTDVDEARVQFEVKEESAHDSEEYKKAYFERGEGSVLATLLRGNPADLDLVWAILDPKRFENHVAQSRERLSREHNNKRVADPSLPELTGEDLDRALSADLELRIVLVYDKIFSHIHEEAGNRSWEDAAAAGFMASMETAKQTLDRAMNTLADALSITGSTEKRFYKRMTEQVLQVRDVMDESGDVVEKSVVSYKTIPTAGTRAVDMREFVMSVKRQAFEDANAQAFLHNIQTAWEQGTAPEGGFWSQLSRYSDQLMKTLDVDGLPYLPDGEVIMAAWQLYSKYVEEEFAMLSWTHQTRMFQADFQDYSSELQNSALEDLKLMFGHLSGSDVDWRIKRAMKMGIGISRAIYLTEAAAAAMADPGHKGTGDAAYQSYYTNDATALETLNPLHRFDRWQAEGVRKGPLLFMPVEGLDRHYMRWGWNHNKLWEEMRLRNESYMHGRFGKEHPYKGGHPKRGMFGSVRTRAAKERLRRPSKRMVTFLDTLPNIGNIGSPIDRGAWRLEYALDGWIHKDKTGNLMPVESWKALENVGYEAINWLIGKAKLDGDNFNQVIARDAYKKYIDPSGRSSFDAYYKSLNNDPKVYMSHVKAYILRRRIPTKLIRLERDRLSDEGTRTWEKIRLRDLGGDPAGWSADEMNKNMRLILMVEQQVRLQTSKKMEEGLGAQRRAGAKPEDIDLSKVVVDDYVVDKARIRKELTDILSNDPDREQKIAKAEALFDALDRRLDRNFMDEFARKIRTNRTPEGETYFPFALAAEELDTKFVAFRNTGNLVLKRALGDIGKVETDVTNNIMNEWINTLHKVAIGHEKMQTLVAQIGKAKEAIEQVHGAPLSHKIAHHLATVTVAYFKKDAAAKNIFTKIFNFGRPHSIAAEMAGGSWKGIHEWEVSDIDTFVTELERDRIIPYRPTDLSVTKEFVTRKLFGFIPFGTKVVHHFEGDYSARSLRADVGGTHMDMFWEIVGKFALPAMLFLLYQMIKKGAEEVKGGGGRH